MSSSLIRVLTCDGCAVELREPPVLALATLRRHAREAGWRQARGGRDMCPGCLTDTTTNTTTTGAPA